MMGGGVQTGEIYRGGNYVQKRRDREKGVKERRVESEEGKTERRKIQRRKGQ